MATLDETNGLYDVAGVNHIFKIPGAYAEKAPIGARALPCANKRLPTAGVGILHPPTISCRLRSGTSR